MQVENCKLFDVVTKQRMDAHFFQGMMQFNNCRSLNTLALIKGGKRMPKGESFSTEETGYLYLRLSDINDYEHINYQHLKYISEELYKRLSRYEVKNNELVISIAGTVGRVFSVSNIPKDKRVILTENCAKIKVSRDDILLEYLKVILQLDFIQNQINKNRIKTTIPKLGLDKIGKIQIPHPPVEKQQEIIDIYNAAIKEKQEKEQESKTLLESIDAYLLYTLCVNPNQETSNEKMFKRSIADIIGSRLDVSFYKQHFELSSDKYPNKKFGTLVEIDPTIKITDKDLDISFVPMECVDEEYGEIKKQRTVKSSQTKGFTKFAEGDLLWAKITPCMQNGKSAMARDLKNGLGCGSTEFYVMRSKTDDLLIGYVYLILRHKEVLKAAQGSYGGTAGQQRVSKLYLKSITIPLPPIEVQQEIINEISYRKQKAKQLQSEGARLLEEAKQQIEQMILK